MTQSKLPLVALISGGKDSIFNILECIRNGYEIHCLAYLQPINHQEIQELDSFMFQSVGHNVVTQAYSDCLGIPLIVHQTDGKSKFRNLEYFNKNSQEKDEVEDLFVLLSKVLDQFPQIKGVTSGAIFSDYQRNRVENVCSRLGLVSVAMLWRREQDELLDTMIENDINAILIKTASMGLKPNVHCGKSISQLRDYLMKLKDDFQMNCCGEGGEYESLVLDCPLFSKLISIDKSRVIVEDPNSFTSSGHLLIEEFHLEEKHPSLYLDLKRKVLSDSSLTDHATPKIFINSPSDPVDISSNIETLERHSLFQFCNKGTYLYASATYDQILEIPLEQQVYYLMNHILKISSKHGFQTQDALQCLIFISDMDKFSIVNQGYSQFFQDAPPSRACVAFNEGLLSDLFIILILGDSRAYHRRILHVQSVSPWAPACIGPYSQASIFDNTIRVAGQIALQPISMQLVPMSQQSNKCLQNLQQILTALRSDLSNTIVCVIYVDKSIDSQSLKKEFLSKLNSFKTKYSLSTSYKWDPIVYWVPVHQLPKSANIEYLITAIDDQTEYVDYDCKEMDGITIRAIIVNERQFFLFLESMKDSWREETLSILLKKYQKKILFFNLFSSSQNSQYAKQILESFIKKKQSFNSFDTNLQTPPVHTFSTIEEKISVFVWGSFS